MAERRLTHLPDLLDAIASIDRQTIEYEHRKLHAIREWALQQLDLDYEEGDRVVITRDQGITRAGAWGWMPYREALAVGALATVSVIDFNPHAGRWTASIVLEREWSVGGDPRPTRYWHGQPGTTPPGYRPPTAWEVDQHPNGRRHTFTLPATDLRVATDADEGLVPPAMPAVVAP